MPPINACILDIESRMVFNCSDNLDAREEHERGRIAVYGVELRGHAVAAHQPADADLEVALARQVVYVAERKLRYAKDLLGARIAVRKELVLVHAFEAHEEGVAARQARGRL